MYYNGCYHQAEYHISYDRHIIVHMTLLYTRLVTYARLHTFICRHVHVIVIQLFFLFSFRPIVILYTLFICMSTSLFFMHSLGRFLTTLDLHVQILDILFYWSGVCWARTLHEELEFLPIWFWYSCLLFIPVSVLFLILVYQIQSLF